MIKLKTQPPSIFLLPVTGNFWGTLNHQNQAQNTLSIFPYAIWPLMSDIYSIILLYLPFSISMSRICLVNWEEKSSLDPKRSVVNLSSGSPDEENYWGADVLCGWWRGYGGVYDGDPELLVWCGGEMLFVSNREPEGRWGKGGKRYWVSCSHPQHLNTCVVTMIITRRKGNVHHCLFRNFNSWQYSFLNQISWQAEDVKI